MRKIQIAAEQAPEGWGVARIIEGDFSVLDAARALAVLTAAIGRTADDIDARFNLAAGSTLALMARQMEGAEIIHSQSVDRYNPEG